MSTNPDTPKPALPEPVAWRYTDARGHFRYRSFVPRFDVEYSLLKPEPLYDQAAITAAVAEARAVREDGMPESKAERHLRRLLAGRVNMPHAYYDDGEAQGMEHGISIDFMREPVADIDAKLRALGIARFECERATTSPAPPARVALGEALGRLMPVFELLLKGAVFTADKAGEVIADMNTLRAALQGGTPSPPPARVVLSDHDIDTITLAQWGPQLGAMAMAHRAYARAVIAEFCKINGITERMSAAKETGS